MDTESVNTLFRRARLQLTNGDAAAAIQDLESSLNSNPDEGRLWALLGIAQWSIGLVRESVASLETAQALTPIGAEGRLTLAQGYEAMQKHTLAADLYATIASEESLPSRVLQVLADCLSRTEQLELAVATCREAVKRRPDNAWPYKAIAYFLSRMGRSPGKIASALKRACQLDPEDSDIHLAYASRLHQCGRSAEAIDALRRVDLDGISCMNCLTTVRRIFVDAGDTENAARCLAVLWSLAEQDDI